MIVGYMVGQNKVAGHHVLNGLLRDRTNSRINV